MGDKYLEGIMRRLIPEKPDLAYLAKALRAEMPAGFRWAFATVYQERDCGTHGCAIGLAKVIWPNELLPVRSGWFGRDRLAEVAEIFGMPEEVAWRIFFLARRRDGTIGGVAPKDIADLIDDYLANR